MKKENLVKPEIKEKSTGLGKVVIEKILNIKERISQAVSSLRNRKINTPVETTVEETKQVVVLGGKPDVLKTKTEKVDTKISGVSSEINKTVDTTTGSILEIGANNEILTDELENRKKELEIVDTKLEENEKNMKRIESFIKIAEEFLDLGLPKETIIKLLGDSHATPEETTLIMNALGGSTETPVVDKVPPVVNEENVPPVVEKVESLEDFTKKAGTILFNAIEKHLSDKPELKKRALDSLNNAKTYIEGAYSNSNDEENKKFIEEWTSFCDDKDSFIKQLSKEDEENPNGTPGNNNTNPETKKSAATIINPEVQPTQEEVNACGMFIMPTNRGFFEKMSEKGRSIVSTLYKGINPVPGMNRVVAKMEIGYNQFWIDIKEGKGTDIKTKMDGLDLEIKTQTIAKTKTAEIMAMLEKSGNPGYAPMALDVKKMEQKISRIQNKKDELQTRLEGKENVIKIYTNKRDRVAENMIGKYERKLSPIEGKLDAINNKRDQTNLLIIGQEIELEAEAAIFDSLEKTRNELVQAHVDANESIEKAGRNKAVKILDKQIAKSRKDIADKKAKYEKIQNEINETIYKIDKEAQPYRDRRDQFVRIKNNRPIDFHLKTRMSLPNETKIEETKIHTRTTLESASSNEIININTSSNTSYEQIPNMGTRISKYNESLRQKNIKTELQIDPNYLTQKIGLRNETNVSLVMFKKAVEQYYKIMKVPESDYKKLLDNLK